MKYATLVPMVLALSAAPAMAVTASYADFADVSALTLNGAAAQSGSVLRLVPSLDTQAGTAYLSAPVALAADTSFSTVFTFHVATDPSSVLGVPDGFTFLLQNSAATALGDAGQGLGYVGITPSVAVVFRGRNPNLVGVITGGVDPDQLPVPFEPPNAYHGAEGEFYGQDYVAWIEYTAPTHLMNVFLASAISATKPVLPTMVASVDLFGTLGAQAYVGFSAGNGGAYGSQDILNWQFFSTPVPEPTTAGLLALGVAVLGLMRRRAVARA